MNEQFSPQKIKKALEHCKTSIVYENCKKCDYYGKRGCVDIMLSDALELINHYEVEIERLQKVQVDYSKAFLDEYAERLKRDFALAMSDGNIPFCEIVDELTNTMKSEYRSYPDFTDLIVEKAITGFAEKLKAELVQCDTVCEGDGIYGITKTGYDKADVNDTIDNLVTEFLNESKVSE